MLKRLLGALSVSLLAGWAQLAAAECVPTSQIAPDPELQALLPIASGDVTRDGGGRMVAPVFINGQGPFRFIVDTGANRTALSAGLATRLGLTPIGTGEVNYVHGAAMAPIVGAQQLRYGPLSLATSPMPVISGPVLAGEAGLLGVDSMRDWRLRLDFERRCIEITSAHSTTRQTGWTTVQGRLRFGSLVVIPGSVRGVAVNILIDTGSDSSLANVALRERLRAAASQLRGTVSARAYTAGEPVVLDSAVIVPSLRLGAVEINNITAYVGDFHVFHLWDLTNEPTLLIGMDVLSRTRAVIIDFQAGSVHFRPQQEYYTGSRLRGGTSGNATLRITH